MKELVWSEAFGIVEDALIALDCHDEFGDPMPGLSALPALAGVVGEGWNSLLDDATNGRLTPREYTQRGNELIEQYRSSRFLAAADRKLNKLLAGQQTKA